MDEIYPVGVVYRSEDVEGLAKVSMLWPAFTRQQREGEPVLSLDGTGGWMLCRA